MPKNDLTMKSSNSCLKTWRSLKRTKPLLMLFTVLILIDIVDWELHFTLHLKCNKSYAHQSCEYHCWFYKYFLPRSSHYPFVSASISWKRNSFFSLHGAVIHNIEWDSAFAKLVAGHTLINSVNDTNTLHKELAIMNL